VELAAPEPVRRAPDSFATAACTTELAVFCWVRVAFVAIEKLPIGIQLEGSTSTLELLSINGLENLGAKPAQKTIYEMSSSCSLKFASRFA
jgi:hypothetical protein